MYFRSAPLQNAPPAPRSTTARTSSSRAIWSPARRRSCAVVTSSELKRAVRSIVITPTGPSRSMRMWAMAPSPSTNPRQQLAVRLGQEPPAEARVDQDRSGRVLDAPADDDGLAPVRARAQRGQHRVRPHRVDRDDRLAFVRD